MLIKTEHLKLILDMEAHNQNHTLLFASYIIIVHQQKPYIQLIIKLR